ncbi:DUF4190 domain-containing protein [Paenibacillus sp. DYY-L-2]|uniref:DUF4190 domain-containing protein n=1 Tax=Paenibacillus sp. DYY-L-2 TaxID=3447013 RepID=UPI003F4FA203
MDQHPSDRQYQYTTFNNFPPGPPGFQPPPPPLPPKTNGKSIASLVLGILSLFIPYIGFIMGIIAIVFASLSFKELKKTGEQGKGLSIAGLVCGIIGTVLYGLIILFVILAVFIFATMETGNIYSNF